MSTNWFAWIALFVPLVAHADVLRGPFPGEACDLIDAFELGAGSKRLSGDAELRRDGIVGFEGRHRGAPALISYTCKDGRIASSLVTMRFETESAAEIVFERSVDELAAEFGPPCTDWRRLPLRWRLLLWWFDVPGSPDLRNRVDWVLPDKLNLGVDAGPDILDDSGWRVSIHISPWLESRVRGVDGRMRSVREPMECLSRR